MICKVPKSEWTESGRKSLQLSLVIALQSSYCTVPSHIHRYYTVQYSGDQKRSLFDLLTTSSSNILLSTEIDNKVWIAYLWLELDLQLAFFVNELI